MRILLIPPIHITFLYSVPASGHQLIHLTRSLHIGHRSKSNAIPLSIQESLHHTRRYPLSQVGTNIPSSGIIQLYPPNRPPSIFHISMKPNMDEPQTPPKYKPGTEHPSENPTNDRDSPIIRTEDSYFADGPVRSGPPNDFRELGLILNKRRATQHVAIRGVGAAWIDQDDSGTYDPKKERATPPATPPPRRRRRSPTDDDDEDRPRPRKSHRRIGYRSLLTFSFTSQKALDYLKSISPGPYDSRTATPEDELSDSTSEAEENDMFGPPLKCRKTRRSTRQRSTLPRSVFQILHCALLTSLQR